MSKFYLQKRSKKAFTLAEVLITLGIIGVVAALTIPTLMKNYQQVQYVTSLKKAYSQMNQVLQQMAMDNGDDIKTIFGNSTVAGDAISSYYKVVKNCKTNLGGGCFAQFNDNYDGSSGTTYDFDNNAAYYKFITADGIAFELYSFNNNCTTNRGFAAAPDSPTYNSACAEVYIDVNGIKGPNNLGRDVFYYDITSNRTPLLYPKGGFYYSATTNTGTLVDGGSYYWNYHGLDRCSTSGDKRGQFCAGRIIDKSWTMDY